MAKCNGGRCQSATRRSPGWTLGWTLGSARTLDLAIELARPLVAIDGSAAPQEAKDLQKWLIDFP